MSPVRRRALLAGALAALLVPAALACEAVQIELRIQCVAGVGER
jgi:hypothetical protein